MVLVWFRSKLGSLAAILGCFAAFILGLRRACICMGLVSEVQFGVSTHSCHESAGEGLHVVCGGPRCFDFLQGYFCRLALE